MTSKSLFGLLFTLVFLTACTSSQIVVGKTRPPIRPEDVKVYLTPPAHFEEIALLDADSTGSFRVTAQGKVDGVIDRLKKSAAKLGANGIILRATGEKGAVIVSNMYGSSNGNFYTGGGLAVSNGGHIKTVSGVAIFVTEK